MSPTSTPSIDSTTPYHSTRTLTSLPTASRDLILQISTDLTRRMNRLLASNRIAAVDVIPIAKDILDLSTLRCLVAEKRSQRLRRNSQQKSVQQRRGRDRTNRFSSTTTLPSPSSTAEAPTWEEMDNHVCAKSRASRISNPPYGSLPQTPVKSSRSWTNLLPLRRRDSPSQESAEEREEVDCHCTRALDLMDLEGDILRSFPDDSGDTLVAPELASWAIGHLRVEAEWTRGMVEELLGEDDDEQGLAPEVGSLRVDSMEPEGGSPLAKSSTSGKSTKPSTSAGTRRVRGWWKSDVDDEGEVEVEEALKAESFPDRASGQMVNIRLRQRKRERVFGGLRRRFSSS